MHRIQRAALMFALPFVLGGCQTNIGRDRADEHDKTALMYAAERGDVEDVRRLLDDGARIDQRVRSHPAIRQLWAFLMWMQDLPDRNDGYRALHYAIAGGHIDVAELLLERGADPNGDGFALSPLLLAVLSAGRQGTDAVAVLLEHGAAVRGSDDVVDPGALVAMAAAHRDTATVRLLLDLGADPDADNPLASAASQGDSLVVELLLHAGADPNQPEARTGWTPAMLARERGHVAIAERLGGGAGSPDQLAVDLVAAVDAGDVDAVRALLEAGADARAITRTGDPLIAEAIRRENVAIVELLLEAGASPRAEQYGQPVLLYALQLGDTLMIWALLEHGANPRISGAATYAAGAGSVAVLRQLRSAGSNLREQADEPLRQAAFGGHPEAVRYLLSLGADPNAPDANGVRPLDRAAARGGIETVRVLLEAGADPNVDSWTPLMGAAMSGDTAMMALLLDFGADPRRRDDQGKSAIDYARGAGNVRAAEWLARRSGRS